MAGIFVKTTEVVAPKLTDYLFWKQVIGFKRQNNPGNNRGLESALWQLQIKAPHGSRYVRSVLPQIPPLIHFFRILLPAATKCPHSIDNPLLPFHPD